MKTFTKTELIKLIETDFDNAIEHICDSICLYNHLLKILKAKAKTKEIRERLNQFKQSEDKIIFKAIDGDEVVFISYFESDAENVDNQLRLPIRLFLDTDSYLAEIDCLVEYLNDGANGMLRWN